MSRPILETRDVSKIYQLGSVGSTSLREELSRVWRRVRSSGPDAHDATARHGAFSALRDVSFDVARGEVVGIIGRNGAGKSTLLKILSRVTTPTAGTVTLRGRVASLLEIGTGFHPELTGRENVFLNGAILGMSKAEIGRKFDEIVAFAGVDEFLDTPVKRYSSGMYVRLAFAVAAHLEPEILLIDEVLAVGDAAFQRKCLGRMSAVAREGRTVLFVSHNVAALAAICDSAVVLEKGAVSFRGPIRQGIDHYLAAVMPRHGDMVFEPRLQAEGVRFRSMRVSNQRDEPVHVLSVAEPIHIHVEYEVTRPVSRVQVVCHVWSAQRVHVLASADIDCAPELFIERMPGIYRAVIPVPASLLAPGVYETSVACGVPNQQLLDEREGPSFEVNAIGSPAAEWSSGRQGVLVAVPVRWQTSSAPNPHVRAAVYQ